MFCLNKNLAPTGEVSRHGRGVYNALEYRELVREYLMSQDLLFHVPTPLSFHVRAASSYWDDIVTVKHPIMAGRHQFGTKWINTPGCG
jgi:hypothetical protein